jgi:hypothetical protein
MYQEPPSPSLRNLPLDRLTLFDMIDVVVKYSISRLSMDSCSSDVGEGRGVSELYRDYRRVAVVKWR